MKKLVTILILIIVNLNYHPLFTLALATTDLESSPDSTITYPKIQLQLKEIAFKDAAADFLIFTVVGQDNYLNLKGLKFFDDKYFKTIEGDFSVKNGSSIKLTFNSDRQDSPDQLQLFTKQKGLTATSEQIIISQGEQYLDFLCWQKSPISKSEQNDWEKIWREDFWEENDISSCFDSEKVQNGQSLIRISDEHNSSAWILKEDQPKTEQKIKSTSLFIDNQSDPPVEPPLRISEIFPAPVTGETEWIELENLTNSAINLQGWIIDDQEGGSKPKILPILNLPANGFSMIKLKELKINLNNSSDQVRIFSPDGKIVAVQEYEEAEKNKSYALITINNEENWQYSDNPTPGKPNQQFTTIKGEITQPAQFDTIYHFTIVPEHSSSTEPAALTLITFEEKIIKGPLAKATFTVGTVGEFTGELSAAPANSNGYQQILRLESFQIISSPTKNDSPPITIIGIIVLTCLAIVGGVKLYQQQKQVPTS